MRGDGGDMRQRKVHAPETKDGSNTDASPSQRREAEETRQPPGLFSFDFVFLLIATVIILFVVNNMDRLDPARPRLFTKEELAEFNGVERAPLYVAMLGEVYDVSKGEQYYGKDKGYYCFVGRDGSRAYVTGEFVKDVTDDVADFNAEKQGGLIEWRQFYRDHSEYGLKGYVIGTFYDEKGRPTDALKAVEEGARQAEQIKTQREAAKKLHPNCNSRWAQGKGGEVWCTVGHPRLVVEYFPGADEKKRCACFEDTSHSKHRQLYENCAPDATRCIIPTKEK